MAHSERSDDRIPMPPQWVSQRLRDGIVIPAHPLALSVDGSFDESAQQALTRYYHAAGAGGLAVGVHTTQFEIRRAEHDLLGRVLELAAETTTALDASQNRQTVLVAGICGPTGQAIDEAKLASDLGYHAGLVSLAALPDASDEQLIGHCRRIAQEIPIFGFYLQPAVGGRVLSLKFWRRLCEIRNLVGIKVSPFDRYKTLDVLRAVAQSGRQQELALYTGNDDTIVVDLLTPYSVLVNGQTVQLQIAGGLLGHWACWTKAAVKLLEACKQARINEQIPRELLTIAAQVTDCNSALFDAANGYAGCIAGIQYVLHQQGILSSHRCLAPEEHLSPGQREEIERVRIAYPNLIDDEFVSTHLKEWLQE